MTQEPTAGEIVRDWLDMAERAPITSCKVLRHPPICQSEIDAIRSLVDSRAPASVAAEGDSPITAAIRAKLAKVKATEYNPGTPAEAMKPGKLDGLNTALAIAMVEDDRARDRIAAHPARMPTRAEVARAVSDVMHREVADGQNICSAMASGVSLRITDALIALFTDTRGA